MSPAGELRRLGVGQVEEVTGRQHALTGPGEYEIGGVFITGIATPSRTDKFNNIVYLFNYNGLTIAHLGDIGDVPSQKQIEDLELVNVLLVPVGGGSDPTSGPFFW